MTARFLVFEGADGVGKSTLVAALAERLRSRSGRLDPNHVISIVQTAEPTGSMWGRAFREQVESGAIHPAGNAARTLIRQDRAAHIAAEIAPALAAGSLVLCDRYRASTAAYQSAPGTIDPVLIATHQRFARPDLTMLVVCDPMTAASRREARATPSRFDDPRRQALLPAALEAALAAFGDPYVTIDTTAMSPAAAARSALEILGERGLLL
jgi:dTMP kinase